MKISSENLQDVLDQECEQIPETSSVETKKVPARKVLKWLIPSIAVLLVLVILAPYINSYVVPSLRISAAKRMIEAGQYKAAYHLLNKCQDNEEAQGLLYSFRVTYGYEKATIFDADGNLEYTLIIERNNNGDITSEIKYDKSSKQVYSKTYLYDEYGNQIEETSENKKEVKTAKTNYVYDDNGNILELARYNYEGKLTSLRKFQYDSNGNKIVEEDYDRSGSLEIRDEFAYDEDNNLIFEIRYSDDGEIVWQTEMEYNERGDIVKETYLGGYRAYTYTPSGKPESIIRVQDDGISSKFEYTYDSSDRLIEYYVYNSSWGTTKEVYEYDSFGNRTMVEVYNDNQFQSRNEYEYNLIGKISRQVVYEDQNTVQKEYVYKYDLRGNLIDRTGYDQDGNVTYTEKQRFGLWGYKTLHSKRNDEDIEFERVESRYGLLGNIRRQKEYRNGDLHYEYKYDIWGNLTKMYGYDTFDEFAQYGKQEIDKLIVEYDDPIILYEPID